MTESPLSCLQDLDSDFPTASALEDSNALALAIIPEGKSFHNPQMPERPRMTIFLWILLQMRPLIFLDVGEILSKLMNFILHLTP